jgi:hypothetical protein
MKSTKIMAILIVVLSMMVCLVVPAEAGPMGTAWTYQGRLMDANSTADGEYDFTFKLYDADVGGNKAANDVNVGDLDVIDGYFIVELDFGSDVFDGDARWLEIGVRPGDSNDPNAFASLSPRHEITAVPYALQTRGIFVNNTGNVGIGTTRPAEKLDVNGNVNINSVYKIGADTVLSVLGFENIFVGIGAGANNTGIRNTFLGHYAGNSNTNGEYNIFLGRSAGFSNTTGDRNTFIGSSSGNSNKEGYDNTFLGLSAGYYNTHGDDNTFLGAHAGFRNTTGNNNTFLGDLAGYSNQTGAGNVFIGYEAGYNETGSNKLYIANSSGTPLIYGDFSTGNVGIGTTSPGTKLHVYEPSSSDVYMSVEASSSDCEAGVRLRNPAGGWDVFANNDDGDFGIAHALSDRALTIKKTTGNVGIGTTSPLQKLHVKANSGDGEIRIEGSSTGIASTARVSFYNSTPTRIGYIGDASSGTDDIMVVADADNDIRIYTNPGSVQERLRITSSGNVGIGTMSPTAKLEVNGQVKITDGSQGAAKVLTSDASGLASWQTPISGADNLGNHTATQNVKLNGNWLSGDGGNEGVYVTPSGNVGIGTTNPQSSLSVGGDGYSDTGIYSVASGVSGKGVYGEASNSGDITNTGGYFKSAGKYGRGVFSESTGSDGRGVYGVASNSGSAVNYGGYFQTYGNNGRGVYGVASSSGGVVNYGGYFKGAGTSGRGVYGEATGSTGHGVYGEASNTSDVVNYGGWFRADGGKGIGVYGYAPGSSGIGVRGYGNKWDFYAANTGSIDYGSASSIRWKRDVRPIDDPLGKVLRIRGVYFNWDAEHGSQHDVGMIAEEVGDVLPEIVEYEENGIDASGMDYSKLTPLLVEAVKALKVEIDELQRQNTEKDSLIDTLKQQNDRLESSMAALESSVATITFQLKGGEI